jgi:hypothetical protein
LTPDGFGLSNNYPNPFNPTTRIRYSVPRNCTLELKVYNPLGQEVACLFEGVRQAGVYTATFDGSDLPSGVYLCRLKAEGMTETRKLLLIR